MLKKAYGPLEVTRGEPGQYTLRVILTGYGVTPEQAEEERDRLTLDWDIGVAGEHHLHAAIQRQDTELDGIVQESTGSWSDAMQLELPSILVESLEAETRDGDIQIDNLEESAAVLESRDGDVTVQDTTMDALSSPRPATATSRFKTRPATRSSQARAMGT